MCVLAAGLLQYDPCHHVLSHRPFIFDSNFPSGCVAEMDKWTGQRGELEKSVDGRVVLASALCCVSCGDFMMDLLTR